MCTWVSREGIEQVVGRVDRLVLAGVLLLPADATEHPVARTRRELLAPEELLGTPRDWELTDRLLSAVEYRVGERLRLVDRRHGLRLLADLLAITVELGRVDRAR